MKDLVVITPSYGPDAELFRDLYRSVLENTSSSTVHHVIVPRRDEAVFSSYRSLRCEVRTVPELVPGRYRRVPMAGLWCNLKRPWPPVRGWVLQQALKIAAAGAMTTSGVLIADSDVVLIRRTGYESFERDCGLGLYRAEGAVHAGMGRHVQWHNVARRLLGLEGVAVPPLHDYVSPFNIWEPEIVRAMQARISAVTGMSWMDAVTSELHVSEFVLYGVFVDEVLSTDRKRPHSTGAFCHNYWDTTPLDRAGAEKFASEISPDALAMMISAKSGTPGAVRLVAEARCKEIGGEATDAQVRVL